MSTRSQEIQVGIAVIVSLVILVVGLLWFQQYQFRAQHQVVRVRFETVGGLGGGDPVHVRGIPMGEIRSVGLQNGGVLVEAQVRSEVLLAEDASFEVGSTGLVGERVLNIDPGTGTRVDPSGRVFEGRYQLAVTEYGGRFEEMQGKLMSLLDGVEKLVDTLRGEDGLGDALAGANQAADAVVDFLESNADDLGRTSRSMAVASARLESLLVGHGDSLGEGADRLASVTSRADSLLAVLQKTADDAQRVLTAVHQQEGAVGRLIMDPELGDSVESSILEMQKLVADIRRNPERYLHLTLIGF